MSTDTTAEIVPMHFDEFTDEEIRSQDLDDLSYEVREFEPSADDEAEVERYLRAFRHYTDQLADMSISVDAQADHEIRRIEQWRDQQTRGTRNALAYLKHRLQQFSEAVNRVKVVSPCGTLKWAKGREHIEIENADNFCAANADTPFVTFKASVSKKEIMAHFKATGEIIPGTDVVRSESTFKVEVPK